MTPSSHTIWTSSGTLPRPSHARDARMQSLATAEPYSGHVTRRRRRRLRPSESLGPHARCPERLQLLAKVLHLVAKSRRVLEPQISCGLVHLLLEGLYEPIELLG